MQLFTVRLSSSKEWRVAARHFILSLVAVSFVLWTPAFSGTIQLKRGQDRIEVTNDGFPVTTAKPYLMPLKTPSGVIVTRPFPSGNDVGNADVNESSFEPHQRPLYFSHGDVDGLDFWGEQVFDQFFEDHGGQAYGHMTLRRIEQVTESGDHATVRARFSLKDPNERVIAEETQTYTFRGSDRANVIDCEFVLHAVAGPVVMGDTKEGTFGIRLAEELSGPHVHMLNSHGDQGEAAIWGKQADWVSYRGTISGKPVGISVFDSPTSFRHPTTWHARAYGLLSANPFAAREFTKNKNADGSWTIPEGESLTFRYRVSIYDGELSREQLDELYRQYAAGK
jgi:hypothetical protein